jgi:CheY-like chemotaxis protein
MLKAGFNFTRHYHPIYNGHEVLQQIKADPVLKKIPVIMLTTSSNEKTSIKPMNISNSYVQKP